MVPLPFSDLPLYGPVFWFAFVLWLLSEFQAWRARRSQGIHNANDRGSLALLSLLNLGAVVMAFALALKAPQAAIANAREGLFVLGVVAILAGIGLRWYAMRLLGRYFTYDVEVQAGQRVIEAGLYRYVRHPSYSGAVLSFFGLGLALGNWAALGAVVLCMAVGYGYRIRVEESLLVVALAPAYADYMQRTHRLIPFVY